MQNEQIVGTTVPHSSFGDPDCCGCLNGVIRGGQADIVCSECLCIVRTVPAVDLRRIFDEMELSLAVASAKCPHCGAVHLSPGFSELLAFVCDECEESVRLKADPNGDQTFS